MICGLSPLALFAVASAIVSYARAHILTENSCSDPRRKATVSHRPPQLRAHPVQVPDAMGTVESGTGLVSRAR